MAENKGNDAAFPISVTLSGGLGMQGTSVMIGTRYAWNIDNKGDQVCLERWSNLGPGMCGTLVNNYQYFRHTWSLLLPMFPAYLVVPPDIFLPS